MGQLTVPVVRAVIVALLAGSGPVRTVTEALHRRSGDLLRREGRQPADTTTPGERR